METLKLTKTIYGTSKAHEALDEEFTEFVPKKFTINELFDMYDTLFYDIIKEGKKHSHFNIVQESIRYAGYPTDPKDADIDELRDQIQQIEDDIWSIEEEHPFFKNGSVIGNEQTKFYMHSSRRRQLNSKGALEVIKRRAGKKNMPDSEFVIFVSQNCLSGILVGPPINEVGDLNADIREINRFDDRQFDDLEENPLT